MEWFTTSCKRMFLLATLVLLASAAVAQQGTTPAQQGTAPADQKTLPDAPKPQQPDLTGAPELLKSTKNSHPLEGGAANNFRDFLHELASPWTVIAPAASAGISTMNSSDSSYGHGAEGYANRYAVAFADEFNGKFLRHFLMPTMFNQIEHYHPLGRGNSTDRRIAHAFLHSFVTKTRHDHDTINMSAIPAAFAVAAIGDNYYPDRYTTSWYTAQRAGYNMIGYFGGDLWDEFKPDVCHKLHLPCGKSRK